MPFSFHFDPEQGIERNYINNGSQHIVTVDLGDNDYYQLTYFLFVNLAPLIPPTFAETELIFALGEYNPEYDKPYYFYDGSATKHHVPNPRHRKIILNILVSSVAYLIEQARPSSVFMQACEPNLPEKAVAKYKLILGIFEKYDYLITELEQFHGQRAWKMELVAQT